MLIKGKHGKMSWLLYTHETVKPEIVFTREYASVQELKDLERPIIKLIYLPINNRNYHL